MRFINSFNNQLQQKSKKINLSGIILTYREEEVKNEEEMPDTQEIKQLMDLLNEHPEINTLQLDNCAFFDRQVKFLASGLKFITEISLQGNDVTTLGLKLLLQIPGIKKIDLRNAHLSGDKQKWNEIIDLIPESLVELQLDGNRAILGPIKDKVANKIQENIKKLQIAEKSEPQPSSSQSPTFFRPTHTTTERQNKKEEISELSLDSTLKEAFQLEQTFCEILKQLPQHHLESVLAKFQHDLINLRNTNSDSPPFVKSQN